MNITAQVAEVTKQLAAANEVVDAQLSHNMENWIILNKRGAITTVSAESRRKIQKILKDDAKPMVPIKRENNSFIIEIFIEEEEEECKKDWQLVKNGAKMSHGNRWNNPRGQSDSTTKNRYEAFWTDNDEGENDSGFTRPR